MTNIALFTLIILFIIALIIDVCYDEMIEETEEREEQKEQTEEREESYLKLLNMTTNEILLFKNKNDFIKTIKQYDTIKYFLKGTEEENNKQLIEWYYPGYKKL